MTFGDALEHVKQGKKARRDAWPAGRWLAFDRTHGLLGVLLFRVLGQTDKLYEPTQNDVLSQDWDATV